MALLMQEMQCGTGEITVREMTPEEAAAHLAEQERARAADVAAAEAARSTREQRAADLAVLTEALPPEAAAALRRLLGQA